MKKIIITCILITTAVITANAQFFIEGSISLNYRDTETLSGTNPSTSSFSISPQVGYRLNNNIALGVSATVAESKSKTETVLGIVDGLGQDVTNRSWNVSLFGRYRLWGTQKLSLHIETPAGIGRSTSEDKRVPQSKYTRNSISISAHPLFSYALSEKFSITTRCDFLSLRFNSYSDKFDDGSKLTTNQFGFDASSTLFRSLSNIRIGVTYNF